MYFYFLSGNHRVLSEWKQWTYCKGLSVANDSIWDKLNIMSRKPDHKLLSFLACCLIERHKMAKNLPRLFNQFTSDEKQDIEIIRSHINTFYSIIIKYVNTNHIFDEVLLNLARIKPE